MTAMIRFILPLFATVLTLGLVTGAASAQFPRPAAEVFQLEAKRGDNGAVVLDWTIAPGTYLYRDSLTARDDGNEVSLALPESEEKDDPNFGLVNVYHDNVRAAFFPPADSGTLSVSYQGCAEQGICYPPVHTTLDLATLEITGGNDRPGIPAAQSGTWSTSAAVAPAQPVTASAAQEAHGDETASVADRAASYLSGNMALMLGGFLGFGLLLSFTPCVFPMIPILSATLAGAGEKLSVGRGFMLSLFYVLAMAAAYGLVGLFAGWSGANLQTALQTPWALGFSAVVFVTLAFGMFGFFELQLPAGLAARVSGRGRGGSLAGAAILGFGSALIVGPCVTPPLAAAMLFAINTGEAAKGAAALFALGLGMGLPLIAVGTFGARILPRSGRWLVAIRKLFGIVFLATAVMLVARLLPPSAALALWGASAICLAVFIGAFDRMKSGERWHDRAAKATGLLAFIFGTVMLVGAAAGEGDPLRPLAFLTNQTIARTEIPQTRVVTPDEFEEALESAGGRPVLVSFTADWCTVCRSNEKIMAAPDIAARIQRVPFILVDVTQQNADAQALMRRFSVIGPPTLLLVDAEGRELTGSRITGAISAETISRKLSQAGA